MSTIRKMLEDQEEKLLHPRASFSIRTGGRERPEDADDLRPEYQRDRDRILHAKSFRRLKGKTQVFLAPMGDHYRTRLTHTLEVTQVARSIAGALRLNEMSVEAMALGHDLGHTPFGHAGERLLDQVVEKGFHHVRQSMRVVEVLEKDGHGLNLTAEVRDGILKHSKGKGKVFMQGAGLNCLTLEAEVVRVSDIVAYVCHDLDDAIRAGLLTEETVPAEIRAVIGSRHSQRLTAFIKDVIACSDLDNGGHIIMSPEVHGALLALRDFLYTRVYETPVIADEFAKAQRILRELFDWCMKDEKRFAQQFGDWRREGENLERAVVDFLSGMTDHYAITTWEALFMPRPWSRV